MTSFDLLDSLFADDCAIFFETRKDMATGTPYLFSHLRKFGLEMLVGLGTTAPKTEAVYYLTGMGSYEDGGTAPFKVSGPDGEDLDFWSFTEG